jgi:hypothetical protein
MRTDTELDGYSRLHWLSGTSGYVFIISMILLVEMALIMLIIDIL